MGRTIIQPIGPLYGEAVNGTVFGRPNGSIFIPSTNQIEIIQTGYKYVKKTGDGMNKLCSSTGTIGGSFVEAVAKSQDNASYIQYQLSDTADFSGNVGYFNNPAGQFNLPKWAEVAKTNVLTIANGDPYYLRAVLMASTNVPVAVSATTVTLTGWSE